MTPAFSDLQDNFDPFSSTFNQGVKATGTNLTFAF